MPSESLLGTVAHQQVQELAARARQFLVGIAPEVERLWGQVAASPTTTQAALALARVISQAMPVLDLLLLAACQPFRLVDRGLVRWAPWVVRVRAVLVQAACAILKGRACSLLAATSCKVLCLRRLPEAECGASMKRLGIRGHRGTISLHSEDLGRQRGPHNIEWNALLA